MYLYLGHVMAMLYWYMQLCIYMYSFIIFENVTQH